MYLLYSMVLAAGLVAMTPWLLLRNGPDGRYTRFWPERFGRAPAAAGAIWLHAVSVGEALAVERLIAQLRQRFPGVPVVLSVTTATGRAVALRRIGADHIFYFPLDFRFAARRALARVRPRLVLIAETEIWPNFLREAERCGVPVLFLNGRISGRSFARYRLVRPLLRPTLQRADSFLMQTPLDRDRILQLGAQPEHVQVMGNLKFDLVVPALPAYLGQLRARLAVAGDPPLLAAGSTMEGEEAILLAAFEALLRAGGEAATPPVLLLAPRHPQRFEAVAALVAAHRLPLTRRSRLAEERLTAGGVVLLDTLGELASTYQAAAVAFIGGSLVPSGGHNLLEAAYWGVPVLVGPHTENFALITEQFVAAGAARVVGSGIELTRVWRELLADAGGRERMGGTARALLASQRGATERALDAIAAALGPAGGGAAATMEADARSH